MRMIAKARSHPSRSCHPVKIRRDLSRAMRRSWLPLPHPAESIDAVEQLLYRNIRSDRFGVRARLEQERINWNLA